MLWRTSWEPKGGDWREGALLIVLIKSSPLENQSGNRIGREKTAPLDSVDPVHVQTSWILSTKREMRRKKSNKNKACFFKEEGMYQET